MHIATDAPCSLRPHHIEIFFLLEILYAARKGENQMAPNLDCKLMFYDFQLQFPEGFQRAGHGMGMGIVMQQQGTL
jgi:hypothetical protein